MGETCECAPARLTPGQHLWYRARRAGWRQILSGLVGLWNGFWFLVRCRLTLHRVRGGVGLRVHGTVHVKGPGRLSIGRMCIFVGDTTKPICLSTQRAEAEIRLGQNVGLNGVTIQCSERVEIGDDSAIAAFYITDSQNHSLAVERRTDPNAPIETAPVRIGRNVWVSVLTTILHGVTIGENSVIGANSVVSRDIPPNCLACGSPAKPVRELT